MNAADVEARLAEIAVLPVVVLDDAADAAPLADALAAGGIPCAEVTLRTEAGVAAMAAMRGVDGFLVGAGTVVSAPQLERSVEAGARFVVSPGWSAAVVAGAQAHGVAVFPGVATASEVMTAYEAGLRTLKLFPAAQLGGPGMITALRGPFPDVRFVPSGGIDIDNAADYLALDAVPVVSTSWVAPRAWIAEHRFDEIAERARTFRAALGR